MYDKEAIKRAKEKIKFGKVEFGDPDIIEYLKETQVCSLCFGTGYIKTKCSCQ